MLRRVAALSLCKYMAVSKRFCDEHLQLLFSILFPRQGRTEGVLGGLAENDVDSCLPKAGSSVIVVQEDLTLRQSLLVAVGDLLFRHPNTVEPWSDRLYAALGNVPGTVCDEAPGRGQSAEELRLTALLVLTHLVLNDMIKPRAVMLVRALWLTSCHHEPTARIARLLFKELGKRTSNVIYNLLPQVIAGLCEPQVVGSGVKVEDSGGQEIIRFIVQFIEKEKHVEGLIEKFSTRLAQCAEVAGGAANSQAGKEAMDFVGDDAGHEDAPARAKNSIWCFAHALGALNYS